MAPRISEWIPLRADKMGAGITIIPWRERADIGLDYYKDDQVVYEVADIWTTIDGRWNNPQDRWGAPQWAIDAYLRPWVNGQPGPDAIAEGGCATHIVMNVRGLDGQYKVGHGIGFSTERAQVIKLPGISDPTLWGLKTTLGGNHWVDIEMLRSSVYFPDQGVQGPWVVQPVGLSDMVVGVGLPYQHHISTFILWQEKQRTSTPTPDPDPDPDPTDPPATGTVGDLLRVAAANLSDAAETVANVNGFLTAAEQAIVAARRLLS